MNYEINKAVKHKSIYKIQLMIMNDAFYIPAAGKMKGSHLRIIPLYYSH